MAYACIDVGSNTTRLLVAAVADGRLKELMSQRAFTRIGKSLAKGRVIPAEKIEETAEVIATQARLARELDAAEPVVLATAAIREASNRDEMAAEIERRTGLAVEVLTDAEEARLAFLGATKTLGAPVEGRVAVVDVGGGSTEIAAGTVPDGVDWFASLRVGSGFLADSYLRSDPPTAAELHAVRRHVEGAFEGLRVPPTDSAVAAGGSASSLRRLVGAELSHESLGRATLLLGATPGEELARRFELDPERVRLLPAGVLLLDEVCAHVGGPLTIGRGGVREGAILELAAGRGIGSAASGSPAAAADGP